MVFRSQKIDADELKKKYRKFALQTKSLLLKYNDRNFNIIKKFKNYGGYFN